MKKILEYYSMLIDTGELSKVKIVPAQPNSSHSFFLLTHLCYLVKCSLYHVQFKTMLRFYQNELSCVESAQTFYYYINLKIKSKIPPPGNLTWNRRQNAERERLAFQLGDSSTDNKNITTFLKPKPIPTIGTVDVTKKINIFIYCNIT